MQPQQPNPQSPQTPPQPQQPQQPAAYPAPQPPMPPVAGYAPVPVAQPVSAQVAPDQPLLADKAEYATKLVGFGTGGMVYLFADRIQFNNKSNQTVAVIPFNTITELNYASGVLRIKVGAQLHAITFFILPYRFMGLVGLMLSGAGKKTKVWVAQLQQLGLHPNKKLL